MRAQAERLPRDVRAGLSRFAAAPVDLRRILGEAGIVLRPQTGTKTAIDRPRVAGACGLLISTALSSPRELEDFRDETLGVALNATHVLGGLRAG